MSIVKSVTCLAAGLLVLAAVRPPVAKADQWNQKTVFTFNQPVEIPGRVLGAGTYVFKLLDSQSDRQIVQIFNKNETHLYSTVLAIPDYRLQPAGKPIITFEERAAGAPQAVKAWFYPGENYGHDFVYPKVKAMALAQANQQPVPSMPNEMQSQTTASAASSNQAVTALKQAPLTAQQPNQTESQVAEAFPPPPAPKPATPAPATPPPSMPKTASPLPLIGLIGLVFLGLGGSVRFAAVRMK